MLKLKCSCGKPLAAGETQCSLCAMGFAPARQVDMSASYQTSVSVQTRQDSGMNCPRCLARLSFGEVASGNCSHCQAVVAKDIIPTFRASRNPREATRHAQERQATVKYWPEKAPTK
jgi:hypothetical protein